MIHCNALNKEFITKEELFKELKANEDKIIALKKAQKYESVRKGQISNGCAFFKPEEANKSDLQIKSGYVYPVINTTRYMDNHDDVHFDGLWKKTLKEQEGRIFYVAGHSLKIDDVIAWPEDVRAFTAMIDWSMVGKEYEGQTEALIYEIEESKIQKQSALDAIKQRRKVQGSVSMIYVKVIMGIDSNEKDYAINKSYFDSHIDLIVNKDQVKDQGYFFGVEEARIYKEGSLVLAGSNDATEIIYPEKELTKCENCNFEFKYDSIPESGMGYVGCPNCKEKINQHGKKVEPLKNTQLINNQEPPAGTLEANIDYEFLIKNIFKK